MSHTRRATALTSALAALAVSGCAKVEAPTLPTFSDLSLSKLNPFGTGNTSQTKATDEQTIIPQEYQSTVVLSESTAESPSAKRYVTRLFTCGDIKEAFAACNITEETTTNRAIAERYVVLKGSHQIRYKGRYVPQQVCKEAGAPQQAHDTQASSTLIRADNAERQ